jgi:hypothetical protein
MVDPKKVVSDTLSDLNAIRPGVWLSLRKLDLALCQTPYALRSSAELSP